MPTRSFLLVCLAVLAAALPARAAPSPDAGAAHPQAGLLVGPGGFLYGTTSDGARSLGVVFRVRRDGAGFRILHEFGGNGPDGGVPAAPLREGPGGFLYGTADLGGAGGGDGIVFRLRPDGTDYALLHSFGDDSPHAVQDDGSSPDAALTGGGDGWLYGTTSLGGSRDAGTVYRVRPDGAAFQILHRFGADGSQPYAPLLNRGDGWLYGTTKLGGGGDDGIVFRLRRDGSGFQILHAFPALDKDGGNSGGAWPTGGLTDGRDGFLYGATENGGPLNTGTLYRMRPDGTGFHVLRAPDFYTEGGSPRGLLAPGDGWLYGEAQEGGATDNGTIFRARTDGSRFQILHTFAQDRHGHDYDRPNGDGAEPNDLADGRDGWLYGTTESGGAGGGGTVFRLRLDGTVFATLHVFSPAPKRPS